jgi:hypothetical protein
LRARAKVLRKKLHQRRRKTGTHLSGNNASLIAGACLAPPEAP